MNNAQLKALLASYGRSVLSAAVALYLSGVTNPADLAWSLAAAVLPVALRAINPKDAAFGRVPAPAVVEQALKTATPKKAPVQAKPKVPVTTLKPEAAKPKSAPKNTPPAK